MRTGGFSVRSTHGNGGYDDDDDDDGYDDHNGSQKHLK